jgi:adhesin/invasin
VYVGSKIGFSICSKDQIPAPKNNQKGSYMFKKGYVIGLYILATSLLFTCTADESTVIGPFGTADKFLTIASFLSSKTILYTEDDSCTVQITVLDRDKNPAEDLMVKFSAQLGSIQISETTDTTGTATVTYYSRSTAGIDRIIADTGLKSDTLFLTLVPLPVDAEPGDDPEPEDDPALPASILLVAGQTSILADGASTSEIEATVSDSIGNIIAGIKVDFSTNLGTLTEQSAVTGADGKVTTTLKSIVSVIDVDATLTATVNGTEIGKTALVVFLGISANVQVDSAVVSSDGYYRAYVKTKLFETTSGKPLESGAATYSSSAGSMSPEIDVIDQEGEAFSVLTAEITPADQFGIIVTSAYSSAPSISDQSPELMIPGVTILVSTLDDILVGDGASFTQVKATLRTTTDGAAMGGKVVQWATTVGTIKPFSITNALGETRDTLRTDLVGTDIVTTFRGSFGTNVFDEINVTFLTPRDSALVLGWAPDPSPPVPVEGLGDLLVTAILADANANPIVAEGVYFWLSENVYGIIGPPTNKDTDSQGRATTRLSYPYQLAGSVVRIWARVVNNTAIRGYIDVILPPLEEAEEEEG